MSLVFSLASLALIRVFVLDDVVVANGDLRKFGEYCVSLRSEAFPSRSVPVITMKKLKKGSWWA